MSHISDGRLDDFILIFDGVVYFFVGGVVSGYEVVLVEVGIVGSG